MAASASLSEPRRDALKNTKLRHRWLYTSVDLFPFHITYSTHLVGSKKLPQLSHASPIADTITVSTSSAIVGAAEVAAAVVNGTGTGTRKSLTQW
nr:unnamed protein product [Leishmania braziliensis]